MKFMSTNFVYNSIHRLSTRGASQVGDKALSPLGLVERGKKIIKWEHFYTSHNLSPPFIQDDPVGKS